MCIEKLFKDIIKHIYSRQRRDDDNVYMLCYYIYTS